MGKFDDIPVFSKFADLPEVSKFADVEPAEGSLSALITRVIKDVAEHPKQRQLRDRFLYHLDLIQRSWLGAMLARDITHQDIIKFLQERAQTVSRATCKHDLRTITFVIKHAKTTWKEWSDLSLKMISEATPYLLKNEIVGQSNVREVRCMDEQRDALIAHFDDENARGKNEIKAMPDIIRFALISSRRRGEIVRMTWDDVEFAKSIYWVRDMKHPTKKKGNDKSFLLWPELAEIIQRQPRVPDEPRIFPYNGNVVGQKFSAAVRALGIEDLHFHDLRGTAISMWMLPPRSLTAEEVRVAVSGHDTNAMIERVYDRRDASDLVGKTKFAALLQPVGTL